MDLSDVKIKPAEGMVAVSFVDDEEEIERATSDTYSSEPTPHLGLLAIVLGVGAKVTGVKVGDTVIMKPWARDGLKLGENSVLCDAYQIAATISS